MNVKKLQDKLDQLYKNVDPTDKKHDDKKILHYDLVGFAVKQKHQDFTWKAKWKNSLVGSVQKLKQSDYKKIIDECYGPNRGMATRIRLAKKFSISVEHISSIEMGRHGSEYVDKDYFNKKVQHWKINHDIKLVLRSPGNDLLKFYDKKFSIIPDQKRGTTLPSTVYKARFKIGGYGRIPGKGLNKNAVKIKALIEKQNGGQFKNVSSVKNIYDNKFPWIVDKDHIEFVAIGWSDIKKLLAKHRILPKSVGYGTKHGGGHKTGTKNWDGMLWNGANAGWSFIITNG
tara:strand:+ start:1770 stop:2627 length:858 start_codon:yes stop_codon:yes gene_type:complete